MKPATIIFISACFLCMSDRPSRCDNAANPDPTGRVREVCSVLKDQNHYLFKENIPENCEKIPSLEQLFERIGDKNISYFDSKALQFIAGGMGPNLVGTSNAMMKVAGSYAGIGVGLGIKNGFPEVLNVFPESPAWEAGLEAGDKLIEVDGKALSHLTREEIASLIKGEPGTTVELLVSRMSAKKMERIKVVRRDIGLRAISSEIINTDIGVIRPQLAIMNSGDLDIIASSISASMREFTKKGITKLILDLRNFGSYLIYPGIGELAGCFIKKGKTVGYIRSNNSVTELTTTRTSGIFTNFKIVVLIDEDCPPGNAMLAEALRKYQGAVLIGREIQTDALVTTRDDIQGGDFIVFPHAELLASDKTPFRLRKVAPDITVPKKERLGGEAKDEFIERAVQYFSEGK